MNDLYEHKAKKYKYKYLKLKAEYIGEGGVRIFSRLPGYNYLNEKKPEMLKLQSRINREKTLKENIEKEKEKEKEKKRYEQIYKNSFERLPKEIKDIYNTEYARIVDVNETANHYINGHGIPETQIKEETFLNNPHFCNEIDKVIHTDENNKEYKNYICYTQDELDDRKKKEKERIQNENDVRDRLYNERKRQEGEKAAAKLAADQAAINEANKLDDIRKENPFYIKKLSFSIRHGDNNKEWLEEVIEYNNEKRVERHYKISKLYELKDIASLNEMFKKYITIMKDLKQLNFELPKKQLTYREIINLLDKEFNTPLPEKEQNKVDAETARVEYWKEWHSGTNDPGHLGLLRGEYGS
jgi:hypothetical protein